MTAPNPLHVCTIMSADLWAGAEVQVATAASYLARRPDLKLSAVLFNDGRLARELDALGVSTAIVDESRHSASEIVESLTTFLRAQSVDVVHTHRVKDNVLGSLAAKRAGVPCIVRTVHGLREPYRGWARARFAACEAIDRAMLWAFADRVIAVSRATGTALGRIGRRGAVMTIHNGIDVGRVSVTTPRETVRAALGIEPDAFVVGTAGRLAPVKGHEYLVHAATYIAASRPDARVVIAGTGPREAELRALIRSLGLERTCLIVDPSAAGATVYDLIAALDVFVLSSLTEGVPMALLEAMALGRPSVAPSVGGIPEVIAHGETGLLVEPRNARALAQACLDLSRNPARAAALGAGGRQAVAARFTKEHNGEAVATVYHDVVRQREAGVGAVAIAIAPLRALAARVRRKLTLLVERRRAERLRGDPAPVLAALARARRILIVCHGNIIRSPFAARLIERMVCESSRALTVASAGLNAEPGRPSHTLAVDAAAPLSIDLHDHAARRLSDDDVAHADAIFVMDAEQRLAMRRRHPGAAAKTFLLTALAADTPLEVRDPIDGDARVFEDCYRHISRAVRPLVRALTESTP